MVTDEQLAAYLAGEMSDSDHADFEAEILADEAARHELLAQRKVSAGLRALLGGNHERLTQAILTTTRGVPNEAIVKRVVAHRPVARDDDVAGAALGPCAGIGRHAHARV